MNTKILGITLSLAAGMALGAAAPARADGGSCPPGYYPIGGGPSVGCAPLPGGSSAPQRSGPRLYWEERFGAIAMAPGTNRYGSGNDQTSKRRARKGALEQCGEDCELLVEYKNTCVALVWNDAGAVRYDRGRNQIDAMANALRQCMVETKQECEVAYVGCSKPVQTY